jgi:hypothetical protein
MIDTCTKFTDRYVYDIYNNETQLENISPITINIGNARKTSQIATSVSDT